MKKDSILTIISFLFMLILGSIHDKYYVVVSLSVFVFVACYFWKRDIEIPNKGYLISGGLVLVPLLIHFVSLWSNLIIIKKLENITHIPPVITVGIIGIIIYIPSIYAAGIVLNAAINHIKNMHFHMISIDAFFLIICLVFVIASAAVISMKVNYHGDEIMSYGLANHKDGIEMSFEAGVTYKPSEDAFMEYITVQDDHRFDYSIPYDNQVHDVHPPLYYCLLHTVSSLFPGTFSRWYAGVINIFFGILSLWAFYKLAGLYVQDNRNVLYIMTVAFALSSGILNAVAWFRMYSIAMFWGLFITWMIASGINRKCNSIQYYILLCFVIIGAALTQYYMIIYSVVICVIYGLILVFERRWKDILGLVLSSGLAAINAITIFPAMLYHMFSGYRGEEALANVAVNSAAALLRNILSFGTMISQDLFGGAGIIIFVTLIFALFKLKDKKFYAVVMAAVIYIAAIIKVAGASVQRYFYPVYGIVFFIGLFSLYVFTQYIVKEKGKYVFVASVTLITIAGFWVNSWGNLFGFSSELLEYADSKHAVDCLYIYSERWMIPPSYEEVSRYNSVTFVNSSHLEMLHDLSIISDDELIVILAGPEIGDVCEEINDAFSQIEGRYAKAGQYGYSQTYYFE